MHLIDFSSWTSSCFYGWMPTSIVRRFTASTRNTEKNQSDMMLDVIFVNTIIVVQTTPRNQLSCQTTVKGSGPQPLSLTLNGFPPVEDSSIAYARGRQSSSGGSGGLSRSSERAIKTSAVTGEMFFTRFVCGKSFQRSWTEQNLSRERMQWVIGERTIFSEYISWSPVNHRMCDEPCQVEIRTTAWMY